MPEIQYDPNKWYTLVNETQEYIVAMVKLLDALEKTFPNVEFMLPNAQGEVLRIAVMGKFTQSEFLQMMQFGFGFLSGWKYAGGKKKK